MSAGSGTNIHNIIRFLHYILVMFHNNYGIAIVAKLLQTVDKSYIVTLMQSDGRFIQYIKNVDKLRTDLSREPYTLALPSAKAGTVSIE